jgi:hypothetical protein
MCALNSCGVSTGVLNAYLADFEYSDSHSVIGSTGDAAHDCKLGSEEFADLLSKSIWA